MGEPLSLPLLCSDRFHISQVILAMGLDGHVRGRVRHAREAEPLPRLVLIQEGLVRLVRHRALAR